MRWRVLCMLACRHRKTVLRSVFVCFTSGPSIPPALVAQGNTAAKACRKTIFMPVKSHPDTDFELVLKGRQGRALTTIETKTGAKILIQGGRGSTRGLSFDAAADETMHVLIEGTESAVALASAGIEQILDDLKKVADDITVGMQSLHVDVKNVADDITVGMQSLHVDGSDAENLEVDMADVGMVDVDMADVTAPTLTLAELAELGSAVEAKVDLTNESTCQFLSEVLRMGEVDAAANAASAATVDSFDSSTMSVAAAFALWQERPR